MTIATALAGKPSWPMENSRLENPGLCLNTTTPQGARHHAGRLPQQANPDTIDQDIQLLQSMSDIAATDLSFHTQRFASRIPRLPES